MATTLCLYTFQSLCILLLRYMLIMEIAMEITDLIFTGGQIGMNPVAIPFMLVVGFLTPWPYNYWRLKKFGKACH